MELQGPISNILKVLFIRDQYSTWYDQIILVPEIAHYKGISFIKLIEWILKDASKKK